MPDDFQDRYEIISRIGSGGVGAVYKAKDTRLGRMVAVKRLLPPDESEDQAKLGSDLIKEARALSAFQHPNIITVFDYGEDEDGLYIIMELLEGETVEELAQKSQLHVDTLTELAEQCLEGLTVAHGRNLLHRDLKPSNIFVTQVTGGEAQVKLLDFGLAKFSSQPALQTVDQSRSILGSIYFMAPEQFLRQPLDARCDLYQLGCVFFYALASEYAFDGETTAAVMDAHLDHTPKDLATLRPDVPEEFRDWVMSMIAREPDDRPKTAAKALQQLRVIAQKLGLPAQPPLEEEPQTGQVVVQTPTAAVGMSATEAFLQKQQEQNEKKAAAKEVAAKQVSTPVWIAGIALLAIVFIGVIVSSLKSGNADDKTGSTRQEKPDTKNTIAPVSSGEPQVELLFDGRRGLYKTGLEGAPEIAQLYDQIGRWKDLSPVGGEAFATFEDTANRHLDAAQPTYQRNRVTPDAEMTFGLRFLGRQYLRIDPSTDGGSGLSDEARFAGGVSFFVFAKPRSPVAGYASLINSKRMDGPDPTGAPVNGEFFSIYTGENEIGFLLDTGGAVLANNSVSVPREPRDPALCEVSISNDRKTVRVTSWSSSGKIVSEEEAVFPTPIYFTPVFQLGGLNGYPEADGKLHSLNGFIFGARVVSGSGRTKEYRSAIAKDMWDASTLEGSPIKDIPEEDIITPPASWALHLWLDARKGTFSDSRKTVAAPGSPVAVWEDSARKGGLNSAVLPGFRQENAPSLREVDLVGVGVAEGAKRLGIVFDGKESLVVGAPGSTPFDSEVGAPPAAIFISYQPFDGGGTILSTPAPDPASNGYLTDTFTAFSTDGLLNSMTGIVGGKTLENLPSVSYSKERSKNGHAEPLPGGLRVVEIFSPERQNKMGPRCLVWDSNGEPIEGVLASAEIKRLVSHFLVLGSSPLNDADALAAGLPPFKGAIFEVLIYAGMEPSRNHRDSVRDYLLRRR